MVKELKKPGIGMIVMILGTAAILLWIGIYKFTPTEAKAIHPLMENHPMVAWTYKVFSVQAVSNIIGIVEVMIGVLLLVGLYMNRLLQLAGICLIAIFAVTLSFLITTPGVWNSVDGMLVTDFFILKDLIPFGLGIALLQKEW